MRQQRSTRDVFQNPCMKRTSITCNITVHEMSAYCRKLWIRLVTQMFVSIKMPFPYPLSVWSRFNAYKNDSMIFSNQLISIDSPWFRVERCVVNLLFLKWSRGHIHWSVHGGGGFIVEWIRDRSRKLAEGGQVGVQKGSRLVQIRLGPDWGVHVLPTYSSPASFSWGTGVFQEKEIDKRKQNALYAGVNRI